MARERFASLTLFFWVLIFRAKQGVMKMTRKRGRPITTVGSTVVIQNDGVTRVTEKARKHRFIRWIEDLPGYIRGELLDEREDT